MAPTMKKWIEYNPATFAGLVIAALLALSVTACSPRVTSPITGEQVTRTTYAAEVAEVQSELESRAAVLAADTKAAQAKIDAGEAEFERVEGLIASTLDAVGGLAVSAAGPYAGLVTVALGIAGAGLGIDNRRKDGVIKGQKQAIKPEGAA